jgi:hypothetical protein
LFKITLIPQAVSGSKSKAAEIKISGDVLTYNEESTDFSNLPDNSQVDGEYPARGLITKVDGVISIELYYKYGSELAELNQSTDGNDYIFTVEYGLCPCPIVWKVEVQEDV